MESRITGYLVVILMALVMQPNGVRAQRYTCWGGCYNECFLGSAGTATERFACYYRCLIPCLPRSAVDFQYYCQSLCSRELCLQDSYGCAYFGYFGFSDGASVEECFDRCTNICKFSTTN